LVETVFSVLKRKFGESPKARKFQSQIKELKIKLILYNISKIIHSILICICSEEFYRAREIFFFKKKSGIFSSVDIPV
jgi:hypothetical protein